MSVFTSSPIKMVGMSNKIDFVVEPSTLLETKQTNVVDIINEVGNIAAIAQEVFKAPERGAYKKYDPRPFILENEPLYTHHEKFEFFPEISQPIHDVTIRLTGQRPRKLPVMTVGRRITWRDAFEQPINVYNAKGRLLLGDSDRRDNFLFSPNAELYAMRFVLDLVNYVILRETRWGNPDKMFDKIAEYVQEDKDIEHVISAGLGCIDSLAKIITRIVREDPWAIYTCGNISTNLLIETKCDYRHYRCNEKLWEEQQDSSHSPHDDLLETYARSEKGTIDYDDLDDLFQEVLQKTGIHVTDLISFSRLLEETKHDLHANEVMYRTLSDFKRKKREVTRSTKLVSKLIGENKSGTLGFNINQAFGVRVL